MYESAMIIEKKHFIRGGDCMFNWHEEAKKKWDEGVTFWNQKSENMWTEGSRKDIVPLIQEHIKEGSQLLDIGCGDGYGSSLLHRAGYKVTGVDLSSEMVQKARELGESEEFSFYEADIMALPFKDESQDAVMAINVLEWTSSPLHALTEIKRVLKAEGKACIGILGPTAQPRSNSYARLYGKDVICNTMMPWEFEQLANENGLHTIGGYGVYKRGVTNEMKKSLSRELQQALTFLWVFMLEKQA